jgi:ATP-dependent protease ClpP protease subunit
MKIALNELLSFIDSIFKIKEYMKANNDITVYQQVATEQHQGHETRKKLFINLEKELNMPVVSFFTSFYAPVMIEDSDAQMIEGILQKLDLSNGLALLINSPGGIGISAERIINICKSYSASGEFIALVPGKAKSAATMICMGASKIYMSKTSELGPIDPQIQINKENKLINIALCNLVSSYKELFVNANTTQGNIEPYLQQLSNYDAREIKEFESAIELAEDVAVRALSAGMLNGKSKDEIREKIKIFLTPEETKSHGRSIFYEEAKKCGLNIDIMDLRSNIWKYAYELLVRTDNFVSTKVSKCIESKEYGFAASST